MSDISRIATVLVISLISGCANNPAPPPPPTFTVTTDNFCRIMKSVKTTWSVHDTTDTIDAMRTIAHVRTCTCAKRKPKACSASVS